jgi:putative SOS response-associated peptidase YedK
LLLADPAVARKPCSYYVLKHAGNRFRFERPLGARRAVIRRYRDEIEMVGLAWGLKNRDPEERPFRFLRAEGCTFPTRRCLIPASEFHVATEKHGYRFALEDGNWFYLAGIYRPATIDWPESYAVLTIDANPDVARCQDRQGAVLLRRQNMDWLDLTVPEAELLKPLPARSFDVEEIGGTKGKGGKPGQRPLAL